MVVVEGRALRLFGVCNLSKSGIIGITELEVALMINDVVPSTSYMTPLDSFYAFDLDSGGDVSWVEFKVCTTVFRCAQIVGMIYHVIMFFIVPLGE